MRCSAPIPCYKGMKDAIPTTAPTEFTPGEEDQSMMMVGKKK
jgi:hypothetical protein